MRASNSVIAGQVLATPEDERELFFSAWRLSYVSGMVAAGTLAREQAEELAGVVEASVRKIVAHALAAAGSSPSAALH